MRNEAYKFKVGDNVIITKSVTGNRDKIAYIGKKATITQIFEDRPSFPFRLNISSVYNFSVEEFELYPSLTLNI